MASKDYSEDLLIQAPTAELLAQQLGWQSVFAQDDEDFGADSLLGRSDDSEVVLRREVPAALMSCPLDVSGISLPAEIARVSSTALPCRAGRCALILAGNKTRQGYARKRTLKPAGYFFVGAPWSH